MGPLSYNQLLRLVDDGVLRNVEHKQVNAASIDIRLGADILVEVGVKMQEVSMRDKGAAKWSSLVMPQNGYVLLPKQFILARSMEQFWLPDNICAEFKLKSGSARLGLNHFLAGWCDPGWHGSVLTMELINSTERRCIRLFAGEPIGQMVFFEVEPVPEHASYAKRGHYNNDMNVTGAKTI